MAPPLEGDVSIVGLSGSAPMRLKEVITTRQFIFMALGSSIGAGLLLSTGQGQYHGVSSPPLTCVSGARAA